MIESPCINLCTVACDGFCAGCYRTKEEIAKWQRMSEYEKMLVLNKIQERKIKYRNTHLN